MPLHNPDKDLLRRYAIASEIKDGMRKKYAYAVAQSRGESADSFLSRSRAFWEEYEEINRMWIPEDPVYSGSVAATLSTSNDFWTLTSPASGQLRILESFIGGEATVSTVLRQQIRRSTGGTTPTNQTAEKFNTRSPAAASTFATAWSVQPTLSGSAALFQTFNAFGGTDRWVPQPGEELYLVNGEQLSSRSASGTPAVSGHVVWEEM